MSYTGASITADVINNTGPWNTWVHFITSRLEIYEGRVQHVPGIWGTGIIQLH